MGCSASIQKHQKNTQNNKISQGEKNVNKEKDKPSVAYKKIYSSLNENKQDSDALTTLKLLQELNMKK